MDLTEYDAMSVSGVQTILRHKHILVTGYPKTNVQFDARGLRTLANLDAPIDIQGKQ